MRRGNRLCGVVLMIAVAIVMNRTPAFAGDRIAELTTMLSSSSEKTRMSAVLSLARLGDKRAIPALTPESLVDARPRLRPVARAAAGRAAP